MAGNYMDAPASRLAYDRDGSVVSMSNAGGIVTQLSASEARALNSEAETGYTPLSQYRLGVIFPYPTDVAGVFLASASSNNTWTLQTSKDTTTGVDGTWVTHGSAQTRVVDVKPNYRIDSQLMLTTPGVDSTGVRGVRVVSNQSTSSAIKAFHIYADISATATKDRVAFWHPTLDIEVPPAYFDWGNVPRGTSQDRSFRIKNVSEDLKANDISIYTEALTPGVPSVAGMHTISSNGGSTFLTNTNITQLLPGAISSPLILRRVVPTNAPVSVFSARIAADVTNWTS